MHCSEEYLVIYSAHSVVKRSERKVSCFHRLHLFVFFFYIFCLVFSVFYLPTNMACIICLIYFFFQLDMCAQCLCCIFLCVIPTLIL